VVLRHGSPEEGPAGEAGDAAVVDVIGGLVPAHVAFSERGARVPDVIAAFHPAVFPAVYFGYAQ